VGNQILKARSREQKRFGIEAGNRSIFEIRRPADRCLNQCAIPSKGTKRIAPPTRVKSGI